MTNLTSLFEVHDSAEEAITAASLGSRYSKGLPGDSQPRVLCLIDTGDVRALMREVLFSAGYNAVVTAKLEDTNILLKAMTVVLSSQMQSVDERATRQVLQQINPSLSFIVLDESLLTRIPVKLPRNY